RYFMTTPEATRLVLQSLAVGKSGQTLVLDMGKPIRIYELAEQLIRLDGSIPGKDIEIQITGIRPGEKLHEVLVDEDEKSMQTVHPRIYCLMKKYPGYLPVASTLRYIDFALKAENLNSLWKLLSIDSTEQFDIEFQQIKKI
ncbi:MAG: polysaccharide biosynthesis protein, partial [Leptolyngbyaceae cyanobacterium]